MSTPHKNHYGYADAAQDLEFLVHNTKKPKDAVAKKIRIMTYIDELRGTNESLRFSPTLEDVKDDLE